jgi:hypothetical protein
MVTDKEKEFDEEFVKLCLKLEMTAVFIIFRKDGDDSSGFLVCGGETDLLRHVKEGLGLVPYEEKMH